VGSVKRVEELPRIRDQTNSANHQESIGSNVSKLQGQMGNPSTSANSKKRIKRDGSYDPMQNDFVYNHFMKL
jgi:hypothetical protein